jgi:phosphoglucosamine mutase
MRRTGRPLSELVSDIERFPQVLINFRVAEKRPLESLPTLQEAVAKVEKALDGRGRVLIRYSGTEPKARVMVEGEDEARVREYADEIANELKRALGGEPNA